MFNQHVKDFLKELSLKGARPFIVGGAVRDAVLGQDPKDLDIEIYGVSLKELKEIISSLALEPKEVGASFGVLKVNHPNLGELDLTLPRRDNKVSEGHKGFTVEVDPDMTPEEGASRRDFTFNTLMFSPEEGVKDFFGGLEDLNNKVLKHVGPAFSEDPLRVLRGMQFCGRLNLSVHPSTASLSSQLVEEFKFLSKERVWGEWEKWALKSVRPSKGLQALKDMGWLHLFPFLGDMEKTSQNPKWHPEGNVWVHSLQVCDAAAQIAREQGLTKDQRLVLMFSALCHDMAKPATTIFKDGQWKATGHEKAGGPCAQEFMEFIGAPKEITKKVVTLVENHLAHAGDITPRMVRRLSDRLGKSGTNIQELVWLIQADNSGRMVSPSFPMPIKTPEKAQQLLNSSKELGVQEEPLKPLLMGRDLIQKGLTPGPQFGDILNRAFEAQLEGKFSDKEGALKRFENS